MPRASAGRPSERAWTLLAGVVVLVAIGAHHEVLGYWFTGGDSLTLIETSRMGGRDRAIAVLTSPLMDGTNFATNVALFYRPVANLSYALDYALWGLDPFGYHLSDLLFHAVGAVLTAAFVRRVSGDRLVGALAGGLFAIHPITAEVVSTAARRHDVLATVFVLGAVLSFMEAMDRDRARVQRWGLLAGSVLSYLFAVGAKEIGVLAPPVIGIWFLLVAHDRGDTRRETLWRTSKIVALYTIPTLAYLGWRVRVLGGIGGYRPGPWKVSQPMGELLSGYLRSLFYPVDVLGWAFGIDLPVERVGLAVVCGVFVLIGYVLAWTKRSEGMVRSDASRLVAISIAWLVVLGAVFVGFGRYSLRSGYLGLVPFGALVSVLVVSTSRELREMLREKGSSVDPSMVLVFVLGGVLVCSLVWVSPLVYAYDGWAHASAVSSEGLPAANAAYDRTDPPSGSVLAVAGLPRRAGAPASTAERPRARTVPYFYANTVVSWIRLTHPESEVAAYVGGQSTPVEGPVRVNATLGQTSDRYHYRLQFRYVETNRTAGTA